MQSHQIVHAFSAALIHVNLSCFENTEDKVECLLTFDGVSSFIEFMSIRPTTESRYFLSCHVETIYWVNCFFMLSMNISPSENENKIFQEYFFLVPERWVNIFYIVVRPNLELENFHHLALSTTINAIETFDDLCLLSFNWTPLPLITHHLDISKVMFRLLRHRRVLSMIYGPFGSSMSASRCNKLAPAEWVTHILDMKHLKIKLSIDKDWWLAWNILTRTDLMSGLGR